MIKLRNINNLLLLVSASITVILIPEVSQAATLYKYNFDSENILNAGTASDGDLTPFGPNANDGNLPSFVASKTDSNGVTRTDLYDFSVGGNTRSYFFSNITDQKLENYTVGLWVWTDNLTPPSQYSSVFMNDTFQINNNAGNYQFRGSSRINIGEVLNDTWQFITVTFDGNDTKFYLDGVLADTFTGDIGNSFNEIGIGTNRVRDNNGRFLGMIDDVFIDDTALSSTQIQALYNEGVGIVSTVPEHDGIFALLTIGGLGLTLKRKRLTM